MQSVGDAGSIAQVMVVVEDGVGECGCHVPDLLGLSHEVQRAVLDKLQHVGRAVRTVQVDVSLLLTHEGFIALGSE